MLNQYLPKFIRRLVGCLIVVVFFVTSMCPPAHAQNVSLPLGSGLQQLPSLTPVMMQGLRVYPDEPMRFDFMMGGSGEIRDKRSEVRTSGDKVASDQHTSNESAYTRVIKYFLAALTIPEDDLWVNLNPDEPDRIVAEDFGSTQMGRDMLAQDYLLKQITASLLHPDHEKGKEFWQRIYEAAGTTDIPIETLNKVWIVPEKAEVYEHENVAYVVGAEFRVMVEEEYLTIRGDQWSDVSGQDELITDHRPLSTKTLQQVIIPALEHEVNHGEAFAPLRRIFNSLILATWYKRKLKHSLVNQVYSDRQKVAGLEIGVKAPPDSGTEEASVRDIYQAYIDAFKGGVMEYIQEDYDPVTQVVTARRYITGGVLAKVPTLTSPTRAFYPRTNGSEAMVAVRLEAVGIKGEEPQDKSAAMASGRDQAEKQDPVMAPVKRLIAGLVQEQDIGKRLAMVREYLGETQSSLERRDEIDVSRVSIWQYENKKIAPNPSYVKVLAKLAEIDVGYLWWGKEFREALRETEVLKDVLNMIIKYLGDTPSSLFRRDEIQVTLDTIYDYLKGKTQAKPAFLKTLFDLAGISEEDLIREGSSNLAIKLKAILSNRNKVEQGLRKKSKQKRGANRKEKQGVIKKAKRLAEQMAKREAEEKEKLKAEAKALELKKIVEAVEEENQRMQLIKAKKKAKQLFGPGSPKLDEAMLSGRDPSSDGKSQEGNKDAVMTNGPDQTGKQDVTEREILTNEDQGIFIFPANEDSRESLEVVREEETLLVDEKLGALVDVAQHPQSVWLIHCARCTGVIISAKRDGKTYKGAAHISYGGNSKPFDALRKELEFIHEKILGQRFASRDVRYVVDYMNATYSHTTDTPDVELKSEDTVSGLWEDGFSNAPIGNIENPIAESEVLKGSEIIFVRRRQKNLLYSVHHIEADDKGVKIYWPLEDSLIFSGYYLWEDIWSEGGALGEDNAVTSKGRGESAAMSARQMTPGGIDLNPDAWRLDVQGAGGVDCAAEPGRADCIRFDFPPEDIENMRRNIIGFTPVIINIQPIINLPLILGLEDPREGREENRLARTLDLVAVKE